MGLAIGGGTCCYRKVSQRFGTEAHKGQIGGLSGQFEQAVNIAQTPMGEPIGVHITGDAIGREQLLLLVGG